MIRCDVEPIGTRLLVRAHGELSSKAVPRIRATLLKCLAERPDALVVDLTGMVIAEPAAATVFQSAARQASVWPGIPLIVCTPDPAVCRLLAVAHGALLVCASLDDALPAESRPQPPSITETLLPVTGAARHGRELAAEACARWDLPHLTARSALITGELITNAVVHAGTMLDLRLTLGRRYLMLAVRDGSTAVPIKGKPGSTDPAAPRGLIMVEDMADQWGTRPAPDGKVVWAALLRPGRRSLRQHVRAADAPRPAGPAHPSPPPVPRTSA